MLAGVVNFNFICNAITHLKQRLVLDDDLSIDSSPFLSVLKQVVFTKSLGVYIDEYLSWSVKNNNLTRART